MRGFRAVGEVAPARVADEGRTRRVASGGRIGGGAVLQAVPRRVPAAVSISKEKSLSSCASFSLITSD